MKSLIIKTALLLLCTLHVIKLSAQLQADPLVSAAIATASATEKKSLDNINKEQKNILAAQVFVKTKLDQIKTIQKKTYDYLTNISAAVENARDIGKATSLTKQIYKLCGELKKAIANNPQGLLTTAIGTKQISQITSDVVSLYSYIASISLNRKTLLNSAERLTITAQVVHELEKIYFKLYSLVYSVYSLNLKDLVRLIAPSIYYDAIAKKDIAQGIINSWGPPVMVTKPGFMPK